MTSKILTKEINYYYTQCFARSANPTGDSQQVLFVTFASSPAQAKELAKAKVSELLPDHTLADRDIHLYHKNYIRESRGMVESGNYVGENPLV